MLHCMSLLLAQSGASQRRINSVANGAKADMPVPLRR